MSDSLELCEATVDELPSEIERYNYDRAGISTGIVHVGVGGFFRSHLATYTGEVLSDTSQSKWGICGVGIRAGDEPMYSALAPQDFLYTLIVKHPDEQVDHRVVGSMVDFVLGHSDPSAVIAKMVDNQTCIVSLTITEGGYNVRQEDGGFDFENPDVQHDLNNPKQPRTVFGYLTEALRQRRDRGVPAFTVMSCDNVQHNGDLTRRVLLEFTQQQDSELATWIGEHVTFPNSMVDRITPVTTDADKSSLQQQFGLLDRWPVTCEPFRQWVVEDKFACGRPEWENCGAQFVSDVAPYEMMKLRLLNAGHSVLGILGAVHGHATIDQCVSDPRFAAFLRRFMDDEATPSLESVPGIDLNQYKDKLIERFGNPNIRDSVGRICLQSSSKLPVFLIPTIRHNLRTGGSIQFAALVIATWCYYSDRQVNQHGEPLEIVDDLKEELHEAASRTPSDKLALLKLRSVFGDLIDDSTFTDTYSDMIERLYDGSTVVQEMERCVATS